MARVVTICHPVSSLETGGMERQLLEVARGLPQFRHVIVTAQTESLCHKNSLSLRHNDQALPGHVTICREPTRWPDPMWSRRLARVIREHAVDVLHVRNFAMLVDAVAAAELSQGVRVVFSFHGMESVRPTWGEWRARVIREALLRCDARWTVSRRAVWPVCEALGLPIDFFESMPNGVDTDCFCPTDDKRSIRTVLGLPDDRAVVLCVGNLKPVKGHAYLLRAVERLSGGAREACFVFVGRDYLGGAMQRDAAGIRNADVRFVGEREDLAAWYRAADLFVLPSLWEGCSNALLEAMATGVACIATDVGGNGELIEHDQTGVLVPAADAAALAGAMTGLIGDATRRNCLGRAACGHVEAAHSLPVSLGRYADRYSSLAGMAVV